MASPLGVITVSLVVLVLLITASGCAGRDFIVVGGKDGHWTTNPAEPRDHFQINDRLEFRFDKDKDEVLMVRRIQYDACNSTEPLHRLDDGDSLFVFTLPGPYFFISADAGRCHAGERIRVDVQDNTPSPSSSAGNASSPSPSAANAPSPSPAPSAAPVPATNNGTFPPAPSNSSAAALRAGVLACLIAGAAAIL